ncbi:glycosyltransferase family 4 protein [Kribbella deserti]|uniref:Glycosyltransferase family 4 protein n=1 Tax=Kribbella deserti TaxID=1926257 RepID=A0ABV6QID1_9ACTN
MSRILIVTNDFPPRQGGIETFVRALCDHLPADELVVFTSSMPGDQAYDATLPFPVVRDRTTMLVPGPRVNRHAAEVLRRYQADRVIFGAAAPLGLMAPALRKAGARKVIAITHGHETWWAALPGSRQALRRIGESADVMTTVSDWCAERIARALTPAAQARMVRLRPGVDVERFYPGCGGAEVRTALALGNRPVVGCVSRLVARKGQDSLIEAWPRVLAVVPDAVLLLVGGGPDRRRLTELAERNQVAESVVFTGPVAWAEIPPYHDAVDVFAMPCRTRRLGLEPEALGIVALEAAATGKPVLIGDSGGAPETVEPGRTGYVVNADTVADHLIELLTNPLKAKALGEQGRQRVHQSWTWQATAQTLHHLLNDPR